MLINVYTNLAIPIAVGFSGESSKVVTQQPIHALNGICVCFTSEMFCGGNNIACMPMVRCIKLCVNIANFIRDFLEIFCFSSANLKSDKPLCGTIYCGAEPDVFYLHTTHRAPRPRLFSRFVELSLILHQPFLSSL